MEKLNAGLAGRLTLVAAPAGFGKSTLVSHWLQEQQHIAYSWLALDQGDNDLTRFFGYLQLACQRIAPQLGNSLTPLLQVTPLPAADVWMTALINDLLTFATDQPISPCLLILDDYHLIDNQEIHAALTLLIENAPPSFHLILISRADPSLPLARWRVRRLMSEIRVDDLRFTTAEVTGLLNEMMGLKLPEQIEALERRTEGWIAAL